MKKITLTIIILSIMIVVLALAIIILNTEITGAITGTKTQSKNYSYTKAICTDDNLCQDYLIKCNGTELISKTPITGASVQYRESWQDPRTQELIEAPFCS